MLVANTEKQCWTPKVCVVHVERGCTERKKNHCDRITRGPMWPNLLGLYRPNVSFKLGITSLSIVTAHLHIRKEHGKYFTLAYLGPSKVMKPLLN